MPSSRFTGYLINQLIRRRIVVKFEMSFFELGRRLSTQGHDLATVTVE